MGVAKQMGGARGGGVALQPPVELRSGCGHLGWGRMGVASRMGVALGRGHSVCPHRALQESMLLQAGPSADPLAAGSPPGAGRGTPPGPPGYGSFAEQLRLAMALSEREQEEQERRRREEDEELQRILRLSLTDK